MEAAQQDERHILKPLRDKLEAAQHAYQQAVDTREVAIQLGDFSQLHIDAVNAATADLNGAVIAFEQAQAESLERIAARMEPIRDLYESLPNELKPSKSPVCAPVCANRFPIFCGDQPSPIIMKLARALVENDAAGKPKSDNEIAREVCGEYGNWRNTIQRFRNLRDKQHRIIMNESQLAQLAQTP